MHVFRKITQQPVMLQDIQTQKENTSVLQVLDLGR